MVDAPEEFGSRRPEPNSFRRAIRVFELEKQVVRLWWGVAWLLRTVW